MTTLLIALGMTVFVFLVGHSLSSLTQKSGKCDADPSLSHIATNLEMLLKSLQEDRNRTQSLVLDHEASSANRLERIMAELATISYRGAIQRRMEQGPRQRQPAQDLAAVPATAPSEQITDTVTVQGGPKNDVLPQLYHMPVPQKYLNDPELNAIRQKLWNQIFVEKKMSLRSYFGEVRMYPGAFDYYWSVALKLPPGGKIVELGSFFGASTVVWGTALKAIGNTEARIYCVDRFTEGGGEQKKVFDRNMVDYGLQSIVKPVKGESWGSAAQFQDQSIDVIYVDAGHIRIDVLKDVAAWFPKMKKGSLISGHDATPKWEGVLRGAYEWAMQHEEDTLEFSCCEPNTAGIWHYRWRTYGPSTQHGGWHSSLDPTKVEGMVWPKLCPG